MICCACRCDTANLDTFNDHDDLCTLTKHRCNQFDCAWCDMVDMGIGEQPKEPLRISGESVSGWSRKPSRARLPSIDALDLPTTDTGSSGIHSNQESAT